ncbi:hypothetical protein FEM48_Zijuj06G0134200 [Ziziphus jujuba var. spinosa]|uniref:Acyl-activating enzyme 5, peroxisomal n=1 Tax=Ziziphus jujuba var. spinosa TaxID=714518 RepID=A0A978V9J1_ZIZJJ|nr:hypothetical protein FEM48_Zijuj06G0134200 [Ziziphus jujuba var. spinosa]
MEELKPSAANSSPLTPLGFLERASTAYSECTSIVYDNTSYTWSQTYRRCLRLASSVTSMGIKQRHVISVVAFNIPAMYELHFAVPMAGAVLNNINTRLDARTISILLRHAEYIQARLHRSTMFFSCRAPPPAPVLFQAEEVGFVVSHAYGMTETGGIVISCSWKRKWNLFPATERARLKARQGVRTAGVTEVDVVDPKWGLSVKPDGLSLGEIVIKGGCIMLGYLKDMEATSLCMRDGWSYAGNVGVMHPDGYLEITDRSKDVIISGGENVCSAEVESVLYSSPAVNEAAVVGRLDEFWGEDSLCVCEFEE